MVVISQLHVVMYVHSYTRPLGLILSHGAHPSEFNYMHTIQLTTRLQLYYMRQLWRQICLFVSTLTNKSEGPIVCTYIHMKVLITKCYEVGLGQYFCFWL